MVKIQKQKQNLFLLSSSVITQMQPKSQNQTNNLQYSPKIATPSSNHKTYWSQGTQLNSHTTVSQKKKKIHILLDWDPLSKSNPCQTKYDQNSQTPKDHFVESTQCTTKKRPIAQTKPGPTPIHPIQIPCSPSSPMPIVPPPIQACGSLHSNQSY